MLQNVRQYHTCHAAMVPYYCDNVFRYKLYRTNNPYDVVKDFYKDAGVHAKSSCLLEGLRNNDTDMVQYFANMTILPKSQVIGCYDDTGNNIFHYLAKCQISNALVLFNKLVESAYFYGRLEVQCGDVNNKNETPFSLSSIEPMQRKLSMYHHCE